MKQPLFVLRIDASLLSQHKRLLFQYSCTVLLFTLQSLKKEEDEEVTFTTIKPSNLQELLVLFLLLLPLFLFRRIAAIHILFSWIENNLKSIKWEGQLQPAVYCLSFALFFPSTLYIQVANEVEPQLSHIYTGITSTGGLAYFYDFTSSTKSKRIHSLKI